MPMVAAADGRAAPLAREQWTSVKAVLVGSGSDGMGGAGICDAVIGLTGKDSPSDVCLLYVGTPTYDMEGPAAKQCQPFLAAGCQVSELRLVDATPAPTVEDITAAIRDADVILVSGGNPLYAVALWEAYGVPELLREAAVAGTVICGGSCGLICWFDAGHSDSADPASYKNAMLGGGAKAVEGADTWEYVRVPCLGLLPGLICPHHDRVQSNGVLRATDFDAMMIRHPGEYGIAVDHWAALIFDGSGAYSVFNVPDKPGSVSADGTFVSDGSGSPGVWLKEVTNGEVQSTLLPRSGLVSSLLRPAKEIIQDPRVSELRLANPVE